MAHYRATVAVFLSNEGRLVPVGEEFTFDGPVGSTWECLDEPAEEPAPAKRKARASDQADD